MQQGIVDFTRDEKGDWMALLSCGHTRHMRHDPPWFNRPWVENSRLRQQYLGTVIDCHKCEQ